MQYVAFFALLISLLLLILSGTVNAYALFTGDTKIKLDLIENIQKLVTVFIVLASLILFYALWVRDFSFAYVYDYTDKFLPLFYALTAFWAGQEGSFLFWLLCVCLLGTAFLYTSTYKSLSSKQKFIFWCFYFLVQAFFLLIITGPSNPFLKLNPVPLDGRGLNPLLQNIGMIFHPPLLFLGYAGFTVPACFSLALWLGKEESKDWLELARPYTVLSWVFLSIGIVLGAWWSYMELGWGGYWAWDPVENASLIPWLFAAAYLHLAILTRKKNYLHKTTFFLLHLTLISCFFATFLVRGNVVQSLHAFGSGGVTWPLLVFMLVYLLIVILALSKTVESKKLDEIWNKSGLIFITSWLFILLAAIITIATLWPVISKIWTNNTVGLDAHFYNRVCLPIFVGINFLMFLCFILDWKGKFYNKKVIFLGGFIFALTFFIMWKLNYKNVFSMVAVGSSLFLFIWLGWYVFSNKIYKRMSFLGVCILHLGMALIVLGVAISGPFQQEREFILVPGQKVALGDYSIIYKRLVEKHVPGIDIFEGRFEVWSKGKKLAELTPQKRLYAHFDDSFVEIDTYPSLGTEVYISLLGFDDKGDVSVKISLHPAVNWIWIGTVILCLGGLLACWQRKNKYDA
ncbi:MAG: cytochrome c-type biogenesis CcmF C-terminal domain-containing protein [Desulfonauticus sp.]|nr:cytochrome c-type biogenesis CcmF C-terminal domain-containing protein [Desulfonauticus sp.]